MTAVESWESGAPPGRFDDFDGDVAPQSERARDALRNAMIPTIGPAEIYAPLPPVPYLVPSLMLTPGAPAMFGGYGFSGKTVIAQSLALAVASGRKLWDVFPVTKGRVVHVDYEQGAYLTRDRYQRMSRATKLDVGELGDDGLRVAVFPKIYVDTNGAFDTFARLFDGVALAIVDSMRASMPTCDENSSEVRQWLDLLNRVSEETGCVVIVIHHARKTSANDDNPDPKMALRGSSAIYDACGNIFALGAAKGAPVRIEQIKERMRGKLADPFGLRIEDVEGEGRCDWGLRVVHLEPEQLAAEPNAGGRGLESSCKRIVDFLRAQGGSFAGNKGALQVAMNMQRTAFFNAFSRLESSDRISHETSKRTGARTMLLSEEKP